MALLAFFLCFIALVGLLVWAFFAFDRWLHKKNGWYR